MSNHGLGKQPPIPELFGEHDTLKKRRNKKKAESSCSS